MFPFHTATIEFLMRPTYRQTISDVQTTIIISNISTQHVVLIRLVEMRIPQISQVLLLLVRI